MKKVLCIDAKIKYDTRGELPLLIEGGIYEFESEVEAIDFYGNERIGWKLKEFDWPNSFNPSRFIPLSDLDETIVHQETLLQTS